MTRLGLMALVLLVRPGAVHAQAVCANDIAGRLGFLVGSWRVESAFRTPEATWDSTTGAARIRPDLSGCLLREEYEGQRFGEPYSQVALWSVSGFEPTPYQRVFAHSQHGLLVLRQGRFHGDTLVLRSETVVSDRRITEEDRITRSSDSAFEFINRRSIDDGVTWTITRRALYVREGGGAPR